MTLADKIVVLRDGEVMQVGAPMDLFNNPANEFVAGFLGSPKMNFFDGELTDISKDKTKAKFAGEGLTTPLVRLVSTSKAKGAKARLGIRPQHLRLDDKKPRSCIEERANISGLITHKHAFAPESPLIPEPRIRPVACLILSGSNVVTLLDALLHVYTGCGQCTQ